MFLDGIREKDRWPWPEEVVQLQYFEPKILMRLLKGLVLFKTASRCIVLRLRSIHKTKYLVSQSSCLFFQSWSKRMNETRIEKRRKGGQDETSRCAHLAQFPRHWVCPSRRSALGKTAAVTWESRETIVRSLWQPAPALPSGQPGPAAHGFSSSSCLLLCTALSSPTPRITQWAALCPVFHRFYLTL